MKISIIFDNTSINPKLKADWGFSCLIETDSGKSILFDTGGSGHILLENMKEMGIDPLLIDIVFISHNHFDHIGGLSQILYSNPNLQVYLPSSFRGVKHAKEIISLADKPVEILKNIYSTGELESCEQSLILSTLQGVVVITGCSHPGVEKIITAAQQYGKIYALIGGFHDFSNLALLSDIPVICPTHCTQKISEINKAFPDACIEGGAGQIFFIQE